MEENLLDFRPHSDPVGETQQFSPEDFLFGRALQTAEEAGEPQESSPFTAQPGQMLQEEGGCLTSGFITAERL